MPLIDIPDRSGSHHYGENDIQYIVIHHSYTQDLDSTMTWDELIKDHMGLVPWSQWKAHPMSYIGYHAGSELITGMYLNLYGRPEWWSGGHCVHKDMNRKSFGYCFVGKFDEKPPDRMQLVTAARGVIAPLCLRKGWPVSEIDWRIVGHGQVTEDGRSCPGTQFPMVDFRQIVKEEMT